MLLISILLPVLGAVALFIWRPRDVRACHALTMTATLATSACVAWCIFTPGAHPITLLKLSDLLSISFKLDGLGRVFGGLVAFLWPLSTLYAFEYMAHEGGENHFFGFYLLSYAVTLGIAFAEDLMTLYIFYELLTLATLFLVMHGMKPQAVYAGRKYVYYSLGGAAMAFLALATVMYFSGNSNFVAGGIPALKSAPMDLLLPMFVLGFLGFGVKAAIFPFHDWLPAASVAPTPVTALLHAVAVVKAGVFAVIRLTYYAFGTQVLAGSWAQNVVLVCAIGTIVFGSARALRQAHLKRRLAYSTVSNLSYMLLGVCLMTPAGLAAALLHMVVHAVSKITLFFCAGAIYYKSGREYVYELAGFGRRMPVVLGCFLVTGLCLMGIPPLAGFASKWSLALAAVEQGSPLAIAGVAALVISAVLTALYIVSVLITALQPDPLQTPERLEPNRYMTVPLVVLTAACLVLSLCTGPLLAHFSAL